MQSTFISELEWRKMQPARRSIWRVLMQAVLSLVFAQSVLAIDTSYLDSNPALLSTLNSWAQNAPQTIRRDIQLLDGCSSIPAFEAARRLSKLGPAAKGATLALIECMGSYAQAALVEKPSGRVINQGVAILSISIGALTEIGPVAIDPLVYAMTHNQEQAGQGAHSIVWSYIHEDKRRIPHVSAIMANMFANGVSTVRSRLLRRIWWEEALGPVPMKLLDAIAAALGDDESFVRESALRLLLLASVQQPAASAVILASAPHIDLCRIKLTNPLAELPNSLRDGIAKALRSSDETVRERIECLVVQLRNRELLEAVESATATRAATRQLPTPTSATERE